MALAWVLVCTGSRAPFVGPRTEHDLDDAAAALELSLDAVITSRYDIPGVSDSARGLRLVEATSEAGLMNQAGFLFSVVSARRTSV